MFRKEKKTISFCHNKCLFESLFLKKVVNLGIKGGNGVIPLSSFVLLSLCWDED